MNQSAASLGMGYQPSLDGLRALSVLAVIAYHAGAPWMVGGFFGVEVFFVVSGYLITTLLLIERDRSGSTDLRRFWARRARRLLPALFVMLLGVSGWVALFGTAEQQSTLRRDLPWSLLYVNNWGQIFGSTPYFSAADPPVLRHLWSLAVEEQWYVIWPLVFVTLVRLAPRRRAATLFVASFAIMIATALLHGHLDDNTLYLSTPTRASGLLLGAGAAMVWKPWNGQQRAASVKSAASEVLTELVGWVALGGLLVAMVVGEITSASTYRWALALVSVMSVVAVAAAVAPSSTSLRAVLSWQPLVMVGQRSYGLYLWHWPVLVLAGATGGGSAVRVVGALVTAAALNEVTYRYVEIPFRRGGRPQRTRRAVLVGALVGSGVLVGGLAAFYVDVRQYDPAVGPQSAEFEMDAVATSPPTTTPPTLVGTTSGPTPTSGSASPASATTVLATVPVTTVPTTTVPATTTTMARLPRSIVVVGDSQARSFFVNLPDGVSDFFTISDGSIDGCGVHDRGEVRSALAGFGRDFADCAGWAERWGGDAQESQADVALVMLGAWDVFDLQIDEELVAFATPAGDELWLANLRRGIDAIAAHGSQIALLEVPCMRPVENSGARVPPLPERGDDTRVAHLNGLLRTMADERGDVWFVEGPDEWCEDPAIATDVEYRWDGVHVYQQGANLILGAIASPLLQIPVPPGM